MAIGYLMRQRSGFGFKWKQPSGDGGSDWGNPTRPKPQALLCLLPPFFRNSWLGGPGPQTSVFPEEIFLSANHTEPPSRGKRKKKNSHIRWIVTVFFVAVVISSTISFFSSTVLEGAGLVEAFLVLLLIVALGIVFDIIGVAVMSAEEKPFHAMAGKKVPGAAEALHLLRNAEKVSSFCNDVVGDICGVVSGSASAVVAVRALTMLNSETVAQLIMSALVSGVTIAGKPAARISPPARRHRSCIRPPS